jgi:hypothetical protein
MATPQRADFSDSSNLDRRLDQIGWGVFLIMIGAIWLIPSVPQGMWLIGTGVLLLGLNAVRYMRGVSWHRTWTALGLLAFLAGVGELTGIKLPLFAISLVMVGLSLVLRSLMPQSA